MKKSPRHAPVAVAAGAGLLFAAWVAAHFREIVSVQDGWIRFSLTAFFAAAILLFRGGRRPLPRLLGGPALPLAACFGACLAIAGAVFRVRQAEWIGVLALLGSCLVWARPAAWPDALASVFVLYWAHPLPGRFFGALQMLMQHMSVIGSERLLQSLNVRVWADGFILRTGLNTFEVPEWCSGMRTATTVFILGAALCLLKRLRPVHSALVIGAALAQALALNVLRISVMVLLAPVVGAKAGVEFLHNSSGLIVMSAVLLVYAEVSLVQAMEERRRRMLSELPLGMIKVMTDVPLSWHRIIFNWRSISAALLLAVFSGFAAYKGRPEHRAAMVRDVAANLRDSGQLEPALRGAEYVRRLVPRDEEWDMAVARMLMIDGRYADVLAALDAIPDGDRFRAIQKDVLRAYSLMGLGDLGAAMDVVRSLPEETRRSDPRVNMILAEMGARAGQVELVSRSVLVAAEWTPNARRIRALYPFLRANRQWETIARSDLRAPFPAQEQAFSAAEAYMNLNDAPKVADIAMQAAAQWPNDPRALEPLYFMAFRREHVWERRFGEHLARCLPGINDVDMAHPLVEKCFALSRPDLAWSVYRRIEELDPEHPYLAFVRARHGQQWFVFRKRAVGVEATSPTEGIDLRMFYPLGLKLAAWRRYCALVPHGLDFSGEDTLAVRKQALAEAAARFEERAAADALTVPMWYAFAQVLEIGGERGRVREELDSLVARHPAEKERALIFLSEVYERSADWEKVYETLRGYPETVSPALQPMLRLGRAMMNLRLGFAAVHVARKTADLFPSSTQALAVLAGSLLAYGSPEEALAVTERPKARQSLELDVAYARALLATERYQALDNLTRSALLPRLPAPDNMSQHLFLAPAVLSMLWHRVRIPSDREFAEQAELVRAALGRSESPFLSGMMKLWLDAHAAHCGGGTADPARWAACGRDPLERATALNQLALLLCRDERFAEAREAARMATAEFPSAPVLWHMYLSLAGGDRDVQYQARAACPEDPELWLAEIVRMAEDAVASNAPPALAEKILSEIRKAADADRLPSAYMTRAGEHLFRAGFREAAGIASQDAVERAGGQLPSYVFGIRIALSRGDAAEAKRCTRLAIDASLKPPPILYEKLVDLKSVGEVDTDSEMVEALRNLRVGDPDNSRWAQMLGYIRFKRGGWEIVDALYQMNVALEGGATNKVPFVVAAESSRLLGNVDRAADYLRRGLEKHPEDMAMLNNLVYTLAFDPRGLDEALRLAPVLLEKHPDDVLVLDTAALVYLRAERTDEAEALVPRILEKSADGSVAWFRANMYLASISLKRGRPAEADEMLRYILQRSAGMPDEDVLAANRLLAEAQGARSSASGVPPPPAPPIAPETPAP
ncbi:MAG: hypothetical protein FJ224_08090 [Lentisphaerae bacterium]|nr:hypothetical protein [Lentisphaerota bacterium]